MSNQSEQRSGCGMSIIYKIAGFADGLTIFVTTYLAIYRCINGNYDGALLALIACGVWCISCQMVVITEELKK